MTRWRSWVLACAIVAASTHAVAAPGGAGGGPSTGTAPLPAGSPSAVVHVIELRGPVKEGALVVTTNGASKPSGVEWTAIVAAIVAGLFGLMSALYAVRARQAEQSVLRRQTSDDALFAKRARCYERLVGLLQALRKYPKPLAHDLATLEALSNSLTTWYYRAAAGLYLTKKAREAYFDLQDGIRAILEAQTEGTRGAIGALHELASKDPRPTEYVDQARRHFGRNEAWTPPAPLTRLLALDDLEPSAPAIECLRQLGSSLRSLLAEELDSRRALTVARG